MKTSVQNKKEMRITLTRQEVEDIIWAYVQKYIPALEPGWARSNMIDINSGTTVVSVTDMNP